MTALQVYIFLAAIVALGGVCAWVARQSPPRRPFVNPAPWVVIARNGQQALRECGQRHIVPAHALIVLTDVKWAALAFEGVAIERSKVVFTGDYYEGIYYGSVLHALCRAQERWVSRG